MTAKTQNTKSQTSAQKTSGQATTSSTIAPPAIKRASRIAPLQEKVVSGLKKTAMTVAEMAKSYDVTERDVRLAIDRARTKGENIKRLSKNTFGYEQPKAAAKAA